RRGRARPGGGAADGAAVLPVLRGVEDGADGFGMIESTTRSARVVDSIIPSLPAGLLLLADARLPSGAPAHSGGLEAAAGRGWIRDEDDLRSYLRGRLATAGLTAAAFAAAACAYAGDGALGVEGSAGPGAGAIIPNEGVAHSLTGGQRLPHS